uniref:Retrovirus-related Pol polyprotein from transposon TNT 1-94 n=1 Tax=Tanacetum cinerariifolium TaxID=118510 RepID=A0A6L2MNL3_TANCI|nr:retrovirus-related Pol polyprotein from transposon TNT 1-94 [Tanacetum cinerariifolium]
MFGTIPSILLQLGDDTAHERPSDTKDTKIAALILKFNAFKALEGEKLNGTFTRLKFLLNDLENNGVLISQDEVSATFVNSLPRKLLNTEYVVLSSDFKLPDENHMLLRVPRENKMYNVDLKNIKREFSVARTPQQNEVAERKNRTLIKAARIMLADSILPIPFWTEAVNTACYSMNYQPVVAGNQPNHNAGIQGNFDAGNVTKEVVSAQQYVLLTLWSTGSKDPHNTDADVAFDVKDNENKVHVSPYMPALEDIIYSVDEEVVVTEADFSNLETNIYLSMARMVKEQGGLNQINDKDFHTCMFACFLSQKEPKRVHQALKDPSWIEAMQEELLQFKMQKVWVLVDLPKGKRVIGSKWVFRNKKDKRGVVIRNKARLVTQGHTQEKGIDYEEVFTLVVIIEAIRLFLAYASFMGFMVYQMDVKNAFLYGTIKEEVYVCQPLGFKDHDYSDKVYKVVRALYGLHQAPRAWYETLANYLLENGFQRGKIDQNLFIKKQKGDILLVQVYVDDIIFRSTNKELCKAFENLMKDKFQMSSMGELTFFLGLQFWASVLVKKTNDVVKLQALIDKKKAVVTEDTIRLLSINSACGAREDTIRQDLRLDNANGVACLPNKDIFVELVRMGYEKPPPKLTFYKAFFSAQWKFLIHTIVQCMSAKRTAWNEFSSSMASAVISLTTDDLSFHTTKYTSPALTQKVFANMRRIGKGFSRVETPLFDTMLVQPQADAENEDNNETPTTTPTSLTLEPSPPPQTQPVTSLSPPQAQPASSSSTPQDQSTATSMTLLTIFKEYGWEISEEDVKNMLQIILAAELKVEALQVKEDLNALWRLTKEMFSTTMHIEDKEKALLIDFKRLVHQVSSTRRHDIFMFSEKDYPLTDVVLLLMLSTKLQVDKDYKMARDLVMKIFMEANKPQSRRSMDTSSN